MDKTNDRKILIGKILIILASAVGLFLLVSQFPYTGDDWAWGSEIGIQRLDTMFRGYNGRYLGNFLVLALTRNVLLRNFVVSLTLVLIFYMLYRCVNKKSFFLFLTATALFLAMPKLLFRQSIVWTSGFSNYVPPVVSILLFLLIVKNVFDDERPQYKPYVPFVLFFASLAGGLYMENITLANIAVAFLVIVYTLFEHKKLYASHIAYLAGALASAAIMFTNSSYGIIASGNDMYRTVPKTTADILNQAWENCKIIYKELLFNNIFLNIFLCAVMICLFINYSKKHEGKTISKILSYVMLVISIMYTAFSVLLAVNPDWSFNISVPGITDKINFGFSGLYALSLFGIPWLCIPERKYRCKTVFPLIITAIMTVPLTVVTPIGSRCFLPMYILLILTGLYVLNYLDIKPKTVLRKTVYFICTAMICVSGIFYGAVYHTIHTYDVRTDKYIREQISSGSDEVIVGYLPYADYLWAANPENDESMWAYRMKLFKKIDPDTKFVFVSYKEFDKLTK